jgi:hypothetical protein
MTFFNEVSLSLVLFFVFVGKLETETGNT